MKKIITMLCMLLLMTGCSGQQKQVSPKQMLKDIVEKDYADSHMLCDKNEKDYYAALLENETEVTLVLLKRNVENEYEYFGSANYRKARADYGKYEYGDDDTLIVIFSNNAKEYDTISLTFKHLEKEYETAVIKDEVDNTSYILNVVILPSEYSLIKTELS